MNDFDRGYEFAALNTLGVYYGSDSAKWINDVEGAIEKLYSAMNSYDHYKNSVQAQESLKGFLAEEWAFGTANIDAAVKRVSQEGSRLDSHDLGSADVRWDEDLYQLKFLTDPKSIARKLGTTLGDSYSSRAKRYKDLSFEEWAKLKGFEGKSPDDLLYADMKGLVPPDELEEVRQYAVKRIERARSRGLNAEVDRWTKVRDNLTDRVRADNGVEGREATNAEMREKAVKVSNGEKLDPADDNLTTAQLIETEAILKSSLKAGASAAAISAALKVAPEIYRSIDYMIQEGEIDEEHIKAIGAAAIGGAASGFVTGSATAAITAAAGKGLFGQTIKSAAMSSKGANVIAALVVLTVEACRDSYLVVSGRMKPVEMASGLSQSALLAVCGFAGAAVAAAVSGGAAIPILIGSFAGTAVGGLGLSTGGSCVMRVCVDNGVTFFGLVEQDYEIPQPLLKKLGLKSATVKSAEVRSAQVNAPRLSTPKIKTAQLHTVDIAFIERDLVGVNKVGYSLS